MSFSIKTITISAINAILWFMSIPASGAEEFTGYLFAYFTGNDNTKGQESIFFAISDDAHTFKQLNNGKPILSSAKISLEGGVRDPHILRGENNDFYMVATDMVSAKGWASNSGIVMLRSTNLIDWQSSTVDIPASFNQFANADRVWAPQTIYDPTAGKYMVYFAMRLGPSDKDKIYYAYADSTFTKLESAPKLLFKYGSNSAIDADIIYKDSTCHLFFKTEGSGNGIKKATSKNLTEGYTLYDKYLQPTSDAVEGSCVFKLINSDSWVLMYDVYTSGRYEFALSTDLKTFTKDPKPVSFDFKPRHGTIIPITYIEKNAMLAKWNPTAGTSNPVINHQVVSYSLNDNSLKIMFREKPVNGSINLFDLTGKLILHQTAQDKLKSIKLDMIPAGVYYVRLETGNGISWDTKISVH